MRVPIAYAAMLVVIALPAFTAPAEQIANDRAAKQARIREMNVRHMPFVLRIANKYPAAEFATPVQREESK